MAVTGVNHVTLSARDLAESVRFWVEVFGLTPIATAAFGVPVQWLQMGDQQLHLFEAPAAEPPRAHHLAIDVDDFESVVKAVLEREIADTETFGHWLYRFADGAVQLYLRDPGGNLVEVDWPDYRTLDPEVVADLRPLPHPQEGEAATATLFSRRR